MSNLMDIIQKQISGQVLEGMSQQLGTNTLETANAASSAINVLLGALSKNARDQRGASALNHALENDHDGSVLDDILGAVSGVMNPQNNSRSLNGAGILGHILGANQNPMIDMIGKMTGMDKSKTGQLMMMLAPVVMGALGKTKRQQNLNEGGLYELLNQTTQQQRQKSTQMDIFTKVLDADGDGSAMDEIMQIGGSLLGGLFKK